MKKISLTIPVHLLDMLARCPDRQRNRVGLATQIEAICAERRQAFRGYPRVKGGNRTMAVNLSDEAIDYLRSFPEYGKPSKVITGLIEEWVERGGKAAPKPRSTRQGFQRGNPGGGYRKGRKYGKTGPRPDLKYNGLAGALTRAIRPIRNDIAFREIQAIAREDYTPGSFRVLDSGYVSEVILRIDQRRAEAGYIPDC